MSLKLEQKNITDSRILVLNSNLKRKKYILKNVGIEDIYIGNSNVTDTNGILLTPNSILRDIDFENVIYNGDFYAICKSGINSVLEILEEDYK